MLEWPCRDDDVVGGELVAFDLAREAPAIGRNRPYLAIELDRESEPLGVPFEVGDDLVAAGVAVGVSWEVEPGQGVVATRREQGQRVAALAPGGADPVTGLQSDEPQVLPLQVVREGEAGLAGADDDHVVVGPPGHRAANVHVVVGPPGQRAANVPPFPTLV